MAPKMVVVVARVLGTVTTAGVPFLDHAMLRFKLIWKADSSRKTQFLVKSMSVFSHLRIQFKRS
ncbi:hypothetical protein RO3G_09966 [Rhizopus delemar RA 99-880]|uniref:Uncharacterized protein n=1 Tax=Rhizopus delemar (strain RA 99-880 / ATCC MYA-4621 / FGSC 9543 / NRRL 43880) TaxID=246409 RepID=I1C9X6_RHIO9|nr:hypothetical protein RO3G_09963 [Rhizopus delemar RA 99-880]EIE85256.1 hypothetical protein RO3G_09966 [Rhizopus delemar RA 99-880]|eukprot:EIE85253.1 hypothetical protein RO3G_09963 [Rhizopus delemar RA 99-880]